MTSASGLSNVHLEVATRKSFNRPPDATAKKEEVLQSLDLAEGQRMDALVIGRFSMKWDDLPAASMVRAFRQKNTSGSLEMSITTVEMKFKGAPISRLHWKVLDEESPEEVHVGISLRQEMVLDQNYLTRAEEKVTSAFTTFLLEKPPSVIASQEA